MDFVVFLRAANVGGRNLLKSAEVVRRLGQAGVRAESHGASGNFVLRGVASRKAGEEAIRKLLPPKVGIITFGADELLAVTGSDPYRGRPTGGDIQLKATFLVDPPTRKARLPMRTPDRGRWRILAFELKERVAFSLYRVVYGEPVDVTVFLERELGVEATTRTWDTVLALARKLEEREA